MSENIGFCIECSRKVTYSVKSERVELNVRGTKFSYVELFAICEECGSEIYLPEINDANVEAREEAYRKAARLITVNEINEILDKYNIGAGPLAKLIGFGEVTINRYLKGQLPSRDHSDKLLNLKYNRDLMKELLEKGRSKITSVAYEKCRERIDELDQIYSKNKIDLVARYFFKNGGDITPLALQKLLYYAQAFYYAIFKEVLFDNDCQAWAYGPVFPEVYYKYKDYGYNPIENFIDDQETNFNELTIKELKFLDIILSSFGCYSGIVLSKMTHNEKPWIVTRGSLQPEDRSITVIDKSIIRAYFDEVVDSYNMINLCDISNYSKDMYEKTSTNNC